MKKRYFALTFAAIASVSWLRAQTELNISHPQDWWFGQQAGAIEEALITVSPHGLYMEVGLHLTLGSPDFNPEGDSLEIEMKFNLPEGAILVDSWLWVEDEIIRAAILDRWTASTIYEGIVDRRQDPSILYRIEDGRYRLQIYPLLAEQTRKIKMTYLVPAQWSATEVAIPLPLDILGASATAIPNAKIRVRADSIWGAPRLKGLTGAAPDWAELATGVWETALPDGNTFTLAVDAPLNEGVFVSTLPIEGPDVYQMAILPEELFELEATGGRKLLVVIEYQSGSSPSVSKGTVLGQIKQQLLATLTPDDAFNLLTGDYWSGGAFSPRFFRPNWVSAHPDSITAAIQAFHDFSTTTYLQDILPEGISFIQDQGSGGELLLFANSDQFSHFSTANPLLDALQTQMEEQLIPIHVCDFQSTGFDSHWIEGVLYRGNEYFYTNLTRISGGSFFNQLGCCHTFAENVQQIFALQSGLPGIIDIYTGLTNGFSFQRYNLGISSGLTNLKKPILQLGRLQGNGAFRIEANMERNGIFQSRQILLTEDLSTHSDTMIQEMWAGNHLKMLDLQANNNSAIQAAIQFSRAERVLGKYTAFLCLEPSQGGDPCPTCVDEDEIILVDTETLPQEALVWTAFPNPFSSQVRVDMKLPKGLNPGDWSLNLFDARGRKIRQFQTPDIKGSGQDWQLTWDARDEGGLPVPSGVYFLVLSAPHGRYHLKLICVR
jgi:Ca-activated chloride channel family protein